MTRPTTRDELLAASADRFSALLAFIDALTPEQLEAEFPGDARDRNVRDILAHLDAWHRLQLQWHDEGMAGGRPEIPAPGYTWATLDELNVALRDRYAGQSLEQVRAELESSHDALDLMVASHTDGELFTPGAYPWLGDGTLGELAIECSSAHYDWALERLREAVA